MLQQINKILNQALGKDLDAKIKHYFISGAYKSMLLQGAIALITFFSALLIARITGDEGFGVYTTVFTWISIVSVGATLGLDDLLLKQIPIYTQAQQPQKINAILSWTNKWGLLIGLLSAVLLLLLAYTTDVSGLANYKEYYLYAVWVIPLFVLMHINQAALRGLKLLWWGQFAEKFVQPLSFFILLLVCYGIYRAEMTDLQAIISRTISFLITVVAALYLLWRYTKHYYQEKEAHYDTNQWLHSCRYFALTSLLYIINTRIDIIFLSLYEVGDAAVAHYNAALKLSDMALIPFAVLYTVTAPMFSELYAKGDTQKLQIFYTKTTRLSCLFISVILIVLLLGGKWFLGLFGDSFIQGYDVLMILCFVKFIHVFVGPANYLMMMVGLERESTWILLISVCVTILLHILLIPSYQIRGAAIATLGGLIVFELLISYISYQKSGIMPTIIGRLTKKE